jgi:hypothetical protein
VLDERDLVWCIAIDLVRAHVHERCLLDVLAGGLEQVQRADRVDVKVVEGARGREVMARLRCAVDDGIGLDVLDEIKDRCAVAQVRLVMCESAVLAHEPRLIPTRIAALAEEIGAHVVVAAMHGPVSAGEYGNDL